MKLSVLKIENHNDMMLNKQNRNKSPSLKSNVDGARVRALVPINIDLLYNRESVNAS